jgi:hypothetical protein
MHAWMHRLDQTTHCTAGLMVNQQPTRSTMILPQLALVEIHLGVCFPLIEPPVVPSAYVEVS